MSNSLGLIDVRELARLGLLAYHRDAIWVALSDTVSLIFTLLYHRRFSGWMITYRNRG